MRKHVQSVPIHYAQTTTRAAVSQFYWKRYAYDLEIYQTIYKNKFIHNYIFSTHMFTHLVQPYLIQERNENKNKRNEKCLCNTKDLYFNLRNLDFSRLHWDLLLLLLFLMMNKTLLFV